MNAAESDITSQIDSADNDAAPSAPSPSVQSESAPSSVGGITGDRLRAFIERVERLEEEKVALAEDIKEIYGEAKATGFDVKTIRKIVRLRKMDIEKRREEDELLDLYKAAIGME
jgi:uncharacterized protein (UPF0335 family)